MDTPRGTDLDVVAFVHGAAAPSAARLAEALRSILKSGGFTPLAGIDALKLDSMLEWVGPGERCIALAQPRSAQPAAGPQWRYIYDTAWNSTQLAASLSRAFPELRLLYANLQEGCDATVCVYHDGLTRFTASAAPANVGGLNGSTGTFDAAAFLNALNLPAASSAAVENAFAILRNREPSPRQTKNAAGESNLHPALGCRGAFEALAAALGGPRIYRFFEGWLRSDLDWDEDDIETVLAARAHA